ncbi:MAG: CYTH domain-containing protein [Lachnospiraceae bacterium]|nr:CYTH domain-containing protein [Lachnospiraceae bacterium]MBP3506139.1 CYTH domain-containing protein [Lachnospiraceae bacterium]
MEIERKFLIKQIPVNLNEYPYEEIEQGYLNTTPVLRIRRKNDSYIFTYKSAGLMSREEIELPLSKEAYEHLIPKCDGNLITKTRYRIPEEHGYTIELDIFHGCLDGLVLAEVEFPSEEAALAFPVPDWFTCEVTYESTFHNSRMITVNPELLLSTAATRLSS